MSDLLVKVGKPGEFFCQMCAKKRAGVRAYDFQVWTADYAGFWGWRTITICEPCRKDFTIADLEFEADKMERDFYERHPEASEEERGSRWLDPVSRHLTFPPDVER